MSHAAKLPIEHDRSFSLYFYWNSHGAMLLRSGKTDQHPTRIDILFRDVRWMALPMCFDGLRIERGKIDDLLLPLTAKVEKEAHFMSVFKVISQGVNHYILAAESVYVSEDQEPYYHSNSPLMPDLNYRALTAPLREPGRPSQLGFNP